MCSQSFFKDSSEFTSSKRSRLQSRSIIETSWAKKGVTTAWTRLHRACLKDKNQLKYSCFSYTVQSQHLKYYNPKYCAVLPSLSLLTWKFHPPAKHRYLVLPWRPSSWQRLCFHQEVSTKNKFASSTSWEIQLEIEICNHSYRIGWSHFLPDK